LVLVNKKNYFLFTPLLHEFATGSVSLENLVEPIREIIRCCDYEFIHGEVKRIDLEKKIVELNESKMDYDYLVIALGSKTNFYNIPGAEENSFTLKSLDDAIRLRNHFIHIRKRFEIE
jgi:NADH:ubiquinone reductase (H+-translocating)